MQPAGPVLNTLRVALLGDSGVGKRTYIQKLTKKQYQHPIPTTSQMAPQQSNKELNFHLQSTHGPCQITLVLFQIDFVEYNKEQAYYEQINSQLRLCDSALNIFSLLDRQTYKSTPIYYKTWFEAVDDYGKPMVLVSTKGDDWSNVKVKQKAITFHRKKNLQFYNVIAKAGYNLLQPFEFLFRKKLSIEFTFVNPENFVDFTCEVQFMQKLTFDEEIKKAASFSPLQDDQK